MSSHKHLSDEQKKFIQENYKSMSAKHMAKKLNVSRNAVQHHHKEIVSGKIEPLQAEQKKQPEGFIKSRHIKKTTIILFAAILIFSIFLRKNTFNLPHYRGDQHHYVGLAFKLNTQGLDGYNLRGIDLLGNKKYINLITIGSAKDKGSVLKGLEQGNITYYDQPLHHIPYGFPLAIMVSHKIFSSGLPYYMLAIPNDIELIRQAPPGVGLRNFRFNPDIAGKQFYAIIVPLFFSILLIILVFFLAKELFTKNTVALTAMYLMAISPIDILTSQKIWSDDMTSALTALAALLYLLAVHKNKAVYALLGGIACGISTITKQNGAFIGFIIILWHFVSNFDRLFKKETFLKVIFDKNLILFGAGAILSSGFWFYKVYTVYDNPVYRPHQTNIAEVAKTDWFKMVGGRPWYLYLVGIPYQNPLFVLAYISPLWLWIRKKDIKKILFPLFWLIVFLYIFQEHLGGGGKEHRYMLPAYPAYAVLGAYVANRLKIYINKSMGYNTGTILLIIALAASAFWSISMAMNVLFYNGALIMKPF